MFWSEIAGVRVPRSAPHTPTKSSGSTSGTRLYIAGKLSAKTLLPALKGRKPCQVSWCWRVLSLKIWKNKQKWLSKLVFNKTIISFALVNCEVIIPPRRKAPRWLFISRYPTCAHRIIVKHISCREIHQVNGGNEYIFFQWYKLLS